MKQVASRGIIDDVDNRFLRNEERTSGLLGFWTLSIVRYSKNTEEHNVSETGSVSVFR
jgi:hypothetical protein